MFTICIVSLPRKKRKENIRIFVNFLFTTQSCSDIINPVILKNENHQKKADETMVTGEKIKKIRKFRGISQAELAMKMGYGNHAQARIGQFESGYRIPSWETLQKIAEILDCNPLALRDVSGKNVDELMQIFFWLEEEYRGLFHVFQMKRFPGERVNDDPDTNVYYHDNDFWPAHAPYGFWFGYGGLNTFLKEWVFHKKELEDGLITKEEYFEWKINWPDSCDDCGKTAPVKIWRLNN